MKILIVGLLVVVASMFSLSTSTLFAQEIDYCEGNFDYDQDVDGTDAAVFKDDFGRSAFGDPCPPPDPAPSPIPKTGQTTTYTAGDDGDLEKGVEWPNPRFTDNGDGTVTDNLTGLVWLKAAHCFGQIRWHVALSDINGLSSGLCGLTDGSNAGDWRLPNRFELESLLDFENYNPALPSGHPFTNVWSGNFYHWSSTTYANNDGYSWNIRMLDGHGFYAGKSASYYVWPVRDPL